MPSTPEHHARTAVFDLGGAVEALHAALKGHHIQFEDAVRECETLKAERAAERGQVKQTPIAPTS
jgi:hypothetical protein